MANLATLLVMLKFQGSGGDGAERCGGAGLLGGLVRHFGGNIHFDGFD